MVFGFIGRFLADLATKPGSAPLFDNPANYGLSFEEVTFDACDGVTLSGWLINPGQKKVIIQTHFGIFCSRAGYTNKGKGFMMRGWPRDIKFLEHIKTFADAGYTVLAYDLRNHGASEKGGSGWIYDGQKEYRDVLAAVDFITSKTEYGTSPIGLLSCCMGSSSMTLAHGVDNGLQDVDNIKAHVVIQPLYSGAWFRSMKVPEFLIKRSVTISTERGGPDFDKSPIQNVQYVTAPTMVIQNRNDPIADMDYVNSYFDALKVEKQMVWTDLEKKRLAGYI